MTHPLLAALVATRVVPVVRTASTRHAETAVAWLREASFTTFEITMSVPDAPGLIRTLAAEPGLLVGAGTVASAADADACLAAGARFLVAPWVGTEIVAPARAAGAAVMLGALTPTEVRAALVAGADVVKIFPASSTGGPPHLRALKSVFPGVAFCPTGGVEPGNIAAWMAAGAAFVGIGGKLVDEKLIAAGDKASVQDAARAALATP
jgi:2-dehydro-3-deoxyphosphogluconate aldolase / (4S)-4-hydroxy-2-oxoglutarate aldolase